MPTVLHIDGLSDEPLDHFEVRPGESLGEVLDRMGASFRTETVPAASLPPRKLPPDAEKFIRTYEYEDAASALAVVRRYGWLDAEEFDTTEEARRFIEGGEEYETLAGEAIVDGDEIEVCD